MKYKSIRYLAILIGCLSFACNLNTNLSAQSLFGSSKDESDKPSADIIPATAHMSISTFPVKLQELSYFKYFPNEVVSAWGIKELGFDPMKITEITFLLKTPETVDADPPEWATVLRFDEIQGLAGNMIDELKEKKVNGKTVFAANRPYQPSFMVFDESTIVVGDERFFQDISTANGNGQIAELIADSGVAGQFQFYLDMQGMRPMYDDMFGKLVEEFELPEPIARLSELSSMVRSIESGMETNNQFGADIIIRAYSEEAAETSKEIICDAMRFGIETTLAQMQSQLDINDPVEMAKITYSKRMLEKYEKCLTPKIAGKNLKVKLEKDILSAPVFAMIMGSFGYQMAGPTMKMTPELKHRQAALAFHNYESAYQSFPQNIVDAESGKPLMSRRVAILPFIEQYNLYQNLRMDEPWDSEHNKQFTSMLILTYGETPDAKTTVRYPVFPNSVWDENANLTEFRDITDGLSNTIHSIDAPPEAAIEWANPEPWKISTTNPMRDVFGDRDEVVVTMLDGSSRTLLRKNMTNKKLKAMLTGNGGEVIDW